MSSVRHRQAVRPSARSLLGLALLALPVLASFAAEAYLRGSDEGVEAETFARQQREQCLRSQSEPDPVACSLRAIQLASQLHGQGYGDRVAAALR
ncbi:hypothetical protein [Massilia endophytica]|uniref:hypothetical protein n=1 Tax=Massilia endophytica TaxID=2899220 RepID=UPI001E2D04FB|nr:hypothetical protein [Massilia endophytica]UGQ48753.1 hypothetical protein LSQ66_09915 [Massilia endophytica]